MKYFRYIYRNAMRNKLRTLLTIASIAICLFLLVFLLSFLAVFTETAQASAQYNRLVVMSAQGFTQPVPIATLSSVRAKDGVIAASPFAWYGGTYQEQPMAFAQFGVDADILFDVIDELEIPPNELAEFKRDRAGCAIGRKLSEEYNLKVGDPLPLKGTIYPFDLNLTVRAIFDGPVTSDLRGCYFHWDYLEEGLKRDAEGQRAGNAGTILIKCQDAKIMPLLTEQIDRDSLNSDTPTRTQPEDEFVGMFLEMWGDLRGTIRNVGLAVVFSLICVVANAMAMSMRERTTEVAVLKAIGFSRPLVITLVLVEAVFVSLLGGLLGVLGAKLLFSSFDLSTYAAGQLPFFYIPWFLVGVGLAVALMIGVLSGLVPAIQAARLSVIDGLRKVV